MCKQIRRYDYILTELIKITKLEPPACWEGYKKLGVSTSPDSIIILTELLNNKDWTHKRAVIEAIGYNIRGFELEDELIKLLDDSNEYIITASINSLGNLNSYKSYNKIKILISSDSLEVKALAISKLSKMWKPEDFYYLVELYKVEKESMIKKEIVFVLVKHLNKENWSIFFDIFKDDTIPRHRYWALESLIKFSSDKLLIEKFKDDKDGHIRKKVIKYIHFQNLNQG